MEIPIVMQIKNNLSNLERFGMDCDDEDDDDDSYSLISLFIKTTLSLVSSWDHWQTSSS